jgi:hypothetical protein
MSWGDFFDTAAGAASLMGLVLGLVLGLVSWRSTRATHQLIARGDAQTQTLLREIHSETLTVLDRMDQRADERHREARG